MGRLRQFNQQWLFANKPFNTDGYSLYVGRGTDATALRFRLNAVLQPGVQGIVRTVDHAATFAKTQRDTFAAHSGGGDQSIAVAIADYPNDYVVCIRACSGGWEELNTHVIRRSISAGGVLSGPVPNAPQDLAADVVPGGKVLLTWRYDETDQSIGPATFNVYHNNGSGPVDYVTALDSVTYHKGKWLYKYLTAAYADGTSVDFGVRAASTAGDEETNTTTVSATVDAAGPPAVSGLAITTF